jgi:hypothetical protein
LAAHATARMPPHHPVPMMPTLIRRIGSPYALPFSSSFPRQRESSGWPWVPAFGFLCERMLASRGRS